MSWNSISSAVSGEFVQNLTEVQSEQAEHPFANAPTARMSAQLNFLEVKSLGSKPRASDVVETVLKSRHTRMDVDVSMQMLVLPHLEVNKRCNPSC